MITTPEIICDVFSFLDKDRIERIQLVSQLWNNIIIRHKNTFPLRKFAYLVFTSNLIHLYGTEGSKGSDSYKIQFDGTNLSKIEENLSSRYSQLTVDEVLTNLNDVVFGCIQIKYWDCLGNLLDLMKLATTKTGGRFRGRFGQCFAGRFDSQLDEIVDNYIMVDELNLDHAYDSYIREVCANPEVVQLPSGPKKISINQLELEENEEVLHFTCNGKLNGANRLTIIFETPDANYGNFIRQWFELYRTHQNPISLVGKFQLFTTTYPFDINSLLDAVKIFLNNTQLHVKYSLETKEFHFSSFTTFNQYLRRRCVLYETDSYALVIEMEYGEVTDTSSINASDLDQPPCKKMKRISFCVQSL